MWETLPYWFWIAYYLFLLTTLGTAVFSVIKMRRTVFAVVVIAFTLSIPFVGLVNSIGRAEGMNEFEHLASQLQQGAIWSVFVIIGYLFLLMWWVIYLFKSKNKN